MKTFGSELRRLRKTSGLSAEELSQKIGASKVSVYYWEHGRSLPNLKYFPELCSAIGADPWDLLRLVK